MNTTFPTTLFLILGLLWAAPAAAEDVSEARALYEQGVRYYEDEDFVTAIKLWRKTYAMNPMPAVMYNIAKACEEANKPSEALEAWKTFLPDASGEEATEAQTRIAELEVVVAALDEQDPPEAPEVASEAAAPEPEPEPMIEEPKEPRSYRGLAVGLMGAGAAGAVVTGTVVGVGAHSSASELAQVGCTTLSGATLCDDATATALSSERLLFGVGMGVIGGGVALGAGTVLLAISPKKQEPRVSLGLSDNTVVIAGKW